MTRTLDKDMIAAFVAETIGNKFFSVSFVKKDGTVKTCPRARLNVTSRMADGGNAGTNERSDRQRAVLARDGAVAYVDLTAEEGKGWRRFNLDSVVGITCAGVTLGQHPE